jgi:hypothetical protein
LRVFRAKTIRDVEDGVVGVFGDAACEFVVCAVHRDDEAAALEFEEDGGGICSLRVV